jgi:MFS superfamily sulfate permease-like transporter
VDTPFWNSRSTTWRLARFAVVALACFVALQAIVDAWIAIVVGVVAATLLLVDEVLSRRAGASDRASGASA